jgi:citronellyl-CoA dehydrogenase
MNFTQEHEEIRRNLKRLIDSEINPHVDAWEDAEQFPAHEVFKKLGQLGLLGLTKPEAYGGANLDWSYAMVMAETLGHIRCGGVPMAIGVQTDMATPALARFGSDELRREFLAPSIAGDYVACIGVSEPGAGSDVASIKTTARKDGGDYVINGGKMWITNSLQADWMCLLANTSEGAPHKNKTLICLPMKSKGISKSKIDKIGMMSSDTGLIHFDNVRVPQRYRIGEEGLGLTKPEAYGGAALDWSYAMVMAETLGYIRCGGVPMASGVQTDKATPALARFGSDELRKELLAPTIAGDYVA